MRLSLVLSCSFVLPLAALHCSDPGTRGVVPPAPYEAAADAGPDGAPSTEDASEPREAGSGDADAAVDGDLTGSPPTDDDHDGIDGISGRDVYASAERGWDANPGTPAEPVRSIEAALERAARAGARVFVERGAYPVRRLAAPGSFAVYGGYPPGFQGAPARERTLFRAGSEGVLVELARDARLAHLTILGAASPTPGTSAHALRTSVQRLSLDDVEVRAGNGAEGAEGLTGEDGEAGLQAGGPLVCKGEQQPEWSWGAPGKSSEGKLPGDVPSKRRAEPAARGKDGVDGPDATGALHVADGFVVGSTAQAGLGNGGTGFGAAGGGKLPGGVAPGLGGSGGCPGAGGQKGQTGGASVALLVLDGAVAITRSRLVAGYGGEGGDGGAGGKGGRGGLGGSPSNTAGPLYSGTCEVPADDPMDAACAAWGGFGGAGGAGGHGGAGAGGASITILTAGRGSVSPSEGTTLETGEPGQGGHGAGGSRAPMGQRAEVLHVDEGI